MDYTINVRNRLLNLDTPIVMGILNVTPDSFYANSRISTEAEVIERSRQILAEGGVIIDVGACSTRPGSTPASEEEETLRLRRALRILRQELPEAVVSVDTFRPEVASMAVKEFGIDIINDISGGSEEMFRTVSRLGVPYILTSVKSGMREMLLDFSEKVQQLRDLGQKDIILDPGFGFGKTLDDNYRLMAEMEKLQVLELPLLVGISRKSMIYKLLGITQNEALNGTTFLNTIALMKGANILRVHDVKEAVEIVKMYDRIRS
jgi:dihydropteroate synthase